MDHLWKKEGACRVHQDVLERFIEIEGMGISGWCCDVRVELAVIAGPAKFVAVLVKARPCEQAGQVLRCGARARMASGVVDQHADQVQPVFQGRDCDPTVRARGVAMKERWATGVDSVAARTAPQEVGCYWCDVL